MSQHDSDTLPLEQIKVITLDNYISHFNRDSNNPECGRVFHDLLRIRAQGYGSNYPHGFLPFDGTDFVVWHHLFCYRENPSRQWVPFGGFRHCSLKRCDEYKQTLPLMKTVRESGSFKHIRMMDILLQSYRDSGKDLAYGSGFTILPEFLKKDRRFSTTGKELLSALVYQDILDYKLSSVITAAVLRFKTERLFEKMGYKEMLHDQSSPGPVKKRAAMNEEILCLIAEKENLGEWVYECHAKYLDIIRSRKLLGSNTSNQGSRDHQSIAA